MKDPQQEIFTAIKLDLERKGYKVFDGMLPPDKTPYPFIYLGDMQQIDDENKSAVFGNVFLQSIFGIIVLKKEVQYRACY